ncbi:MAG: hypothetical protein JSW66_12115 [Phycisphaerales bacterium]|nr:MAG: hypothetical protein JSW66_12115 [Phycisphaerales bacterium]
MNTTPTKSVAVVVMLSLALGLCGCNEGNSGLKLNPIYSQALCGALVGGIVGYQSEEPGEGAAVGAALLGVGELLSQMDREHREKEHKHKDGCGGQVVVEIHNDNGSITPVKLKRDGCAYIGPKGERYEQLPTEEQLKPIYGLK